MVLITDGPANPLTYQFANNGSMMFKRLLSELNKNPCRGSLDFEEAENRDIENPTALFCYLQQKDWGSALGRLREKPREAKIWIWGEATPAGSPADGKTEERLFWKLLPLHASIVLGAPSYLIKELIKTYPDGAGKSDHRGSLPIHLATSRLDIDPDGERIVSLLLELYPDSIHVTNERGHTPIELARLAWLRKDARSKLNLDIFSSGSGEEGFELEFELHGSLEEECVTFGSVPSRESSSIDDSTFDEDLTATEENYFGSSSMTSWESYKSNSFSVDGWRGRFDLIRGAPNPIETTKSNVPPNQSAVGKNTCDDSMESDSSESCTSNSFSFSERKNQFNSGRGPLKNRGYPLNKLSLSSGSSESMDSLEQSQDSDFSESYGSNSFNGDAKKSRFGPIKGITKSPGSIRSYKSSHKRDPSSGSSGIMDAYGQCSTDSDSLDSWKPNSHAVSKRKQGLHSKGSVKSSTSIESITSSSKPGITRKLSGIMDAYNQYSLDSYSIESSKSKSLTKTGKKDKLEPERTISAHIESTKSIEDKIIAENNSGLSGMLKAASDVIKGPMSKFISFESKSHTSSLVGGKLTSSVSGDSYSSSSWVKKGKSIDNSVDTPQKSSISSTGKSLKKKCNHLLTGSRKLKQDPESDDEDQTLSKSKSYDSSDMDGPSTIDTGYSSSPERKGKNLDSENKLSMPFIAEENTPRAVLIVPSEISYPLSEENDEHQPHDESNSLNSQHTQTQTESLAMLDQQPHRKNASEIHQKTKMPSSQTAKSPVIKDRYLLGFLVEAFTNIGKPVADMDTVFEEFRSKKITNFDSLLDANSETLDSFTDKDLGREIKRLLNETESVLDTIYEDECCPEEY